MCIYNNTVYKACGCTVSDTYERCGYYDDMFSECMKYSEIHELEPKEGRCGKRFCKNPGPAPPDCKWKEQAHLEVKEIKQAEVA